MIFLKFKEMSMYKNNGKQRLFFKSYYIYY